MGYAVTICRKVLFTTKPRTRAPHFPNYAYKDADLFFRLSLFSNLSTKNGESDNDNMQFSKDDDVF